MQMKHKNTVLSVTGGGSVF